MGEKINTLLDDRTLEDVHPEPFPADTVKLIEWLSTLCWEHSIPEKMVVYHHECVWCWDRIKGKANHE